LREAEGQVSEGKDADNEFEAFKSLMNSVNASQEDPTPSRSSRKQGRRQSYTALSISTTACTAFSIAANRRSCETTLFMNNPPCYHTSFVEEDGCYDADNDDDEHNDEHDNHHTISNSDNSNEEFVNAEDSADQAYLILPRCHIGAYWLFGEEWLFAVELLLLRTPVDAIRYMSVLRSTP
jgi:hypothetical protein